MQEALPSEELSSLPDFGSPHKVFSASASNLAFATKTGLHPILLSHLLAPASIDVDPLSGGKDGGSADFAKRDPYKEEPWKHPAAWAQTALILPRYMGGSGQGGGGDFQKCPSLGHFWKLSWYLAACLSDPLPQQSAPCSNDRKNRILHKESLSTIV